MTARTDIRPPQAGQAQTSTSYTLAIRWAQALLRSDRPISWFWGKLTGPLS